MTGAHLVTVAPLVCKDVTDVVGEFYVYNMIILKIITKIEFADKSLQDYIRDL